MLSGLALHLVFQIAEEVFAGFLGGHLTDGLETLVLLLNDLVGLAPLLLHLTEALFELLLAVLDLDFTTVEELQLLINGQLALANGGLTVPQDILLLVAHLFQALLLARALLTGLQPRLVQKGLGLATGLVKLAFALFDTSLIVRVCTAHGHAEADKRTESGAQQCSQHSSDQVFH